MIAALIILAALVVVGGILYIFHVRDLKRQAVDGGSTDNPGSSPQSAPPAEENSECCGMHITCERDSLSTAMASKIEYYDDEELDAYKDRGPDDYSSAEIEQFRDVLLTLRPSEIAGWARSIQLRGITLPAEVREELLMIVADERQKLVSRP